MANLFDNLPAPAGNGSGSAVNVSAMGSVKTVTVTGTWDLPPMITIEFNNAADQGGSWVPIATFQGAGTTTVSLAARFMRVTVANFRGGQSPEVDVGSTDAGTSFANLPSLAGSGAGASVDTSALPLFKTVQVGGEFRGSVIVEISNDGGASWNQLMSLERPGFQSATFAADFMRVRRNGVPLVSPGLPVINVGACPTDGGGGGGGGDLEGVFDVKHYGAVGNGVADDSAAIRTTISVAETVGGIVYFPPGTYLVSQDASNAYCISVPAGVTISGAGRSASTVKMAPAQAANVRMFRPTGDLIRFNDMSLDGNKAEQSVDEQKHGIFSDTTTALLIERVDSFNFSGDGFTLYNDTQNVVINECRAFDNDRNGITINGAGVVGVSITNCEISNNVAQQFDIEPGGGARGVRLFGNFLAAGVDDYVIACGGNAVDNRSDGIVIEGNVIEGGVFVVWCDNVSIVGNRIDNATTKEGIRVFRSCSGVSMIGNEITCSQTSTTNVNAILVGGTAGDHDITAVQVIGNGITQRFAEANGITIEGCLDAIVANNTVTGADQVASGYVGIKLRATVEATPIQSLKVTGNRVFGFGSYGIACYGSGAAEITDVDISHNILAANTSGVMPIGISFNPDGLGAAQHVTAIGNSAEGQVGVALADYPVVAMLIGGSRGQRGIYSTDGDPNGTLTESVGAIAMDRSGGAGSTLYVKESGTGNTGWVAK